MSARRTFSHTAAGALILVALAACAAPGRSGSATSGTIARSASARPAYAQGSWRIVSIETAGHETLVPTSLGMKVDFLENGMIAISDPVNTSSGTPAFTADGFTIPDVAVSAVGYAGSDPQVITGIEAVTALTGTLPGAQGAVTSAHVVRGRLVLAARGFTVSAVPAEGV